jgi:hypothetical protein
VCLVHVVTVETPYNIKEEEEKGMIPMPMMNWNLELPVSLLWSVFIF